MDHEIDALLEQRDLQLLGEEALLDAARQVRRLVDVAARGDHGDVGMPVVRRVVPGTQLVQHGARLPQCQVAAAAADAPLTHGFSRLAAAMNWCSMALTSEVTLRARCGGRPSSRPGSLFCMNSVRIAVIAASVSLGGGASNVWQTFSVVAEHSVSSAAKSDSGSTAP